MNLPDIDSLPARTELPDPLLMGDGTRVESPEEWETSRKPELQTLFQHYMYGFFPDAPPITATVRSRNDRALGGKATLKQVSITVGPEGCPTIELLVVTPNRLDASPVFLGMNFHGNHSVLDDPAIALPKGWMPQTKWTEGNRATESGRGQAINDWEIEHVIDRGYAVATFYTSDVAPDRPDFTGGVFPYFDKPGQREPSDWAVIAAWAWGLHRATDYLVSAGNVDAERIIIFGHSRNGKAALLAGAFDERVAAIIPHQAGCGGTAPSRCHNPKAETVTAINDRFPHWFGGNFHRFNGQENRLPFDQNCLLALCAPRPVLFSVGEQDQWADPPGQFEVMMAARSAYRLLGAQGMPDNVTAPEMDRLVGRELSYYTRDAKHIVDRVYWDAFMDFADRLRPSSA